MPKWYRGKSLKSTNHSAKLGPDAYCCHALLTFITQLLYLLGKSLIAIYRVSLREKVMSSLDDDIQSARLAFADCVAGYPDRHKVSDQLRRLLYRRYLDYEEPSDIDECIHLARQTLSDEAANESDRATCVKSLAVYLYSRYENARDESDLVDSIRFIKQELDVTPDGPGKAWAFHGLGDRLHDSYTNFGHSEHLDEAVKV